MSKSYNIRWNDDDKKKLGSAVKNFNAKIKRLEKKYPDIKNALPERVTVRQMKNLIETRQDLNREINALNRFSSKHNVIRQRKDGTYEGIKNAPGVNDTIPLTNWQITEMNRRAAIINRKRKRRFKEIAETQLESRGEKLGYTQGQFGMGKADEIALRPLKAFTPAMDIYEIKKKQRGLMVESQTSYWHKRDLSMRESYIKALERNFRKEDLTDIIEAIEEMPIQEFRKIFNAQIGKFENIYVPDDASYDAYLEGQRSTFKVNERKPHEARNYVKDDGEWSGKTVTSLRKLSLQKIIREEAKRKAKATLYVYVKGKKEPYKYASGISAYQGLKVTQEKLDYYVVDFTKRT